LINECPNRLDPVRVKPDAAPAGRLSESQAAVKYHLEQAGHGYRCSSDYAEVIETLISWRVLRGGISVQ
jgi:hypothetical protein